MRSTTDKIECPVCIERSYSWAIKSPLWKSDKCWKHMHPYEKEMWMNEFTIHIKINRGLRSQEDERRYFKEVYLKEHFDSYKKDYIKMKLKTTHTKHKDYDYYYEDYNRDLIESENHIIES